MNAAEIIAWVQKRVPANPPSGFDWYTLLNLAGIDFHNAYSWSFAEDTTTTIEGVPGLSSLALPEDFVAVRSVQTVDLGRNSVRIVTVDQWNELASVDLIGTSYRFAVCFDTGENQQTANVFAPPVCKVWPTPTIAGEPTLRVTYERGWRHIPTGASGAVPNIRRHCVSVFLDFVEQTAWRYFFDTDAPHGATKAARLAQLITKDESGTVSVPVRGGLPLSRMDEYEISGDFETT
jgi:hypothetical protein